MKRIVLFIATNLAVLLVLTIVARLLGLDTWLAMHGQPRVEAQQPRDDRQHQQYGQVGDDEQHDAFHDGETLL